MRYAMTSVLLLGLLTLGCRGTGTADAEPLPEPQTAGTPAEDVLPEDVRDLAASRVEPTPPASNPRRVTATGELAAEVESELVPLQSGRIGKIHVDEGSAVASGQALLELENEYFALELAASEAEVQRARATLDDARRELERKKSLADQQTVPRAVYDRTLSAFETALAAAALAAARLELAKTRLDDTVLRAPFGGVVAERRVDVGEHLAVSTVAFVLIQKDPLKLRFQLPERYLPVVRPGMEVRAFFDPYPGVAFSGKIHRVGQVIDPASRSLRLEALLPNADGRLRPGLFARVEIDLGGGDAQIR